MSRITSNFREWWLSSPIKQVSLSVILVAILVNSLAATADDAEQIARRHADNWTQSLQSAEIEHVMALYASTNPIMVIPNGESLASIAEIGKFWQKFLGTDTSRVRLKLLRAHFNAVSGESSKESIIAHFLLSDDTQKSAVVMNSRPNRWRLEAILERQINGQWQTQFQYWH
ncbi:MAG: hypothetical protein ACU836_15055 [Gammaproteobacteria bacterium]